MIRFTSNHRDLSNDRGFQFEFYCDHCQNGYITPFELRTGGTAEGMLRAVGSFFGGIFNEAANSIDELQDTFEGKARDKALATSIEKAKEYFHQCKRCGDWVCPEVCWSPEAGLCKSCAPNFQEERVAAKADAAKYQVRSAAYHEVELATAEDVIKASVATCPNCNATVTGGKFCSECGNTINLNLTCPGCNIELKTRVKFCPECGTKVPGWV